MVLIPHTNNIIKGSPLSIGEFLSFIGLWLFVTSHIGYNRRDVFADNSIDIFGSAPIRLNVYMAVHRFKNTISALSFTDITIPYLKDKFFEVL